MGEAAPQMRGLLGGGVAVADRVRVAAPVGIFAVPVLAEVAPLAFAACDVVFDEHEIAFLEPLAAREFAPGLGDNADVLVPHNHRALSGRALVELHIGAAYSRHLHLHQGGILRDIRHRVFADLGLARTHPHRRQNTFRHRDASNHQCGAI